MMAIRCACRDSWVSQAGISAVALAKVVIRAEYVIVRISYVIIQNKYHTRILHTHTHTHIYIITVMNIIHKYQRRILGGKCGGVP